MKNKELEQRIKKYTTAAAALVTASGASAQVVYTDVDPDIVHDGDEIAVGLDLDDNSTYDFMIHSADTLFDFGSRVRTTQIAPYGTVGNAIAGEAPLGYNYALALDAGAMIDNTLEWITTTNTMAYNVDDNNPYSENWNGVTDKYLALKFDINGATHYGWARMDVQDVADAWTLKDYAYESNPETGIAAGTVGLTEGKLDQLVHFINQPDNSVLIKINGELSNGQIELISMNGQRVLENTIDGNQAIVDMNHLTPGVYMLSVMFPEGMINKKLMVHK